MLIVCNPLDSELVMRSYWNHTSSRLISTERCPSQEIIFLADRLLMLVESGAWFDLPDSQAYADARRRRDELASLLVDGRPRCCAVNADGVSQCKKPAERPIQPPADGQPAPAYCVAHSMKRKMWEHHIGDGLDQTNPNPLSEITLEALSVLSSRLGHVVWQFSMVADRFPPDSAFAAGQAYAELCDIREEFVAVLRGDREQARKQRSELRFRIQGMVERIAREKKIEGREVHTAYLKAGGKSQQEMSVEELKAKIDWLFTAYADVFQTDTREWQPPQIETSGMEPGGVRMRRPEDPRIEMEEV